MDDFHDIEAEEDIGAVEQPQPGKCAASDELLFVAGDGFAGSAEGEAAAGLYFHEDEGVVGFVAADEIDFAAARRAEVAIENPIMLGAEIAHGEALPFPPELVRGVFLAVSGATGRPGEKIGDESGKAHAPGA